MERLHYRGALLIAFAAFAQPGCGGRSGSEELYQSDVGGSSGFRCLPGDTRECVGPGACRGGQQCSANGNWGICECAASGGATSLGATGGYGVGGEATGGIAPTGGAPTGGTKNYNTSGGTAATGGRSQGGTTFASGGWGGVNSAPIGGTGVGGSSYTGPVGGRTIGGATVGGASPIGGATVGGASPIGGTNPTGGVRTAGGSGPVGGSGPTGGSSPTGGYSPTGGATNRPPQITGLAFYPNPVYTNDTLNVYPTATDPDFDKILYSYAWTCNGKPVGSNSSQLNGQLYFSRGDIVSVTVTPWDGKSYGDPATTQPITVSNMGPQFSTWSALSPTPYADGDATLLCDGSATDPDGDSVAYTYNWYKSDVLTSYHDATLPSSATALGDYWSCEVYASDGISNVWGSRSDTTSIATTASGIYRVDTTWQAAKSPYYLTGRIQIASGVTLKIEPGVTVIGNGYSLEFWGSVQAVGTADKPILIQDLGTYDYSTTDKPGKFTAAYVEYVGGTFLGSANAALVDVSDCVVRNQQSPAYLATGLAVAHRFERNLFSNACGIFANGPLMLKSNTFAFSTLGCFDLELEDTLDASANNFYPNNDLVVMAGPKSVDLHNSYWGGVADSEIPALIMDTNDDLSIAGEVTYLPTLNAASPTAPLTDKTYFP